MSRFKITTLLIFALISMRGSCLAQEEAGKAGTPESATIKGKIVQSDKKAFQIDLTELKPQLFQQVQLPNPPIPDNWDEMNLEKRQAWIKEFEASDNGKAFLEDRKKRLQAAATFDIPVEPSGNFVVYDVPHDRYGLRGRMEKKIAGKNYVLEVFGQIDVSEEVEEVLLDPMMVTVTRLLRAGDRLPEFEVPTFDNKARINNKLLQSKDVDHKFVLFSFWSMESPPSKQFSKTVQEMYSKISADHPLQLISVCVGSDPKEALKFVKTVRVLGWHGYVRDWEDELVDEFGVRVLPALFLVNPDEEIVMTHFDFRREFQAQDADMSKIIVDVITGKNRPTVNETGTGE